MARSQKNKQTSKSKKQAARSVAWIKVVFAILVVGAFVAGLWYLKDSGAGASSDPATEFTQDGAGNSVNKFSSGANKKTIEVPVTATSDERDPLPVLAEEQWEFIEGLPSYSVEVEVNELPNADRRYLMQCGSFRKKSQAEELRATIAFQGMESQVLESKGSKGIWYRVVLGPYESKRDAERDRHTLRSARVNRCQIWNWD